MAKGRDFYGSNAVLGAPLGEEDKVLPLHVHRADNEVISCWSLSQAEIAEIVKHGCVWLSIMGKTMPPAFVSGVPLMALYDADGHMRKYHPDYKEEEKSE